jgi:hypothetical protein
VERLIWVIFFFMILVAAMDFIAGMSTFPLYLEAI